MSIFLQYGDVLQRAGVSENNIGRLRAAWQEPQRYYHNMEHLAEVLHAINSNPASRGLSLKESDLLDLAAIFHDAVYNPKVSSGQNEMDSADWAETACEAISAEDKATLRRLILSTANHAGAQEGLEKILCAADLYVFKQDLSALLRYEKGIMREYQFVPYPVYQAERVKVLRKLHEELASFLSPAESDNLQTLIAFVETYRARIGVYAGSFLPFHKGHFNILQKAEAIFDKVIVVQGRNPEKDAGSSSNVAIVLPFHETVQWEGFMAEFIRQCEEYAETTLVKGLRNGNDLAYEVNQLRFMEAQFPNMRVVYLVCDKEFEHISSSSLRSLIRMGEEGREFAQCFLP